MHEDRDLGYYEQAEMNAKLVLSPKILAAVAGLAALALYLPVLKGGFVLSGAYSIGGADGSPFAGLSLLVDRVIWGTNPMGFHLTGTLLHAANSVLVLAAGYLLLKKEEPWPAFIAALIFALHPANTEAVAWISARGELIYTAFFLLALISYLYYDKNGRTAGLVLAGIFLFLSFMGSEKALSLVAVLPLYASVSAGPGRLRRAALTAAVCAAGAVAFYLLKPLLPGAGAALAVKNPLDAMGMTPGLGLYAENLLLPFGHDLFPGVPDNLFYALAGLSLIAAAILLYIWRQRFEAFLAAWVVITLVPSFFVIDMSGAVLAERHLYLPAAALSILLASLLWRLKSRRAVVAASVAVIVVYSFSASSRIADWKDESRLLADPLRTDEYSMYENPSQASYVLTALGVKEMEAGDYEAAGERLREALRADEKNYMAYYQSNRLFEALHERLGEQGDVDAQTALAREAAKMLDRGGEHFPKYVYLHYHLGIWNLRLGAWNKAHGAFKNVLGIDPEDREAAAFLRFLEDAKERGLWGYNGPASEQRTVKPYPASSLV
jgi:tetratricopeptide (TPR) repeat protein